jgi:hypothetical protein
MQPNGKGGSILSESMPRSVTSMAQEMKCCFSEVSSAVKGEDDKMEIYSAPKIPKFISCIDPPIKEGVKTNGAATISSITKGNNIVRVSQWVTGYKVSGTTHCFIVTKSIGLQSKKKNAISIEAAYKVGSLVFQCSGHNNNNNNNNKEKSYLPLKSYKKLCWQGFIHTRDSKVLI